MIADPLDLLTADLTRRGWTRVTFGCVRLDSPETIAWLRLDGRGGRVWRWMQERYRGPSHTFSGSSPATAARKIDDYARGVVRVPVEQMTLDMATADH